MITVDHLLTVLQSNPTKLPSWIHIAPSAVPGIINSLTYWKTKAPSKSSRATLLHYKPSSENDGPSILDSLPIIAEEMKAKKAQRSEAFRTHVDNMSDKEVIERACGLMPDLPECPGRKNPDDRALCLKLARDEIVDFLLESTGIGGFDKGVMTWEAALYKDVKVLIPPKTILKESKPLQDAWKNLLDIQGGRRSAETRRDDVVKPVCNFLHRCNLLQGSWTNS
jgi:hypothetical protein